MDESQESKTERATIALSKREKQALQFVRIHKGTTESELLRVRLIDDIVAEYDKLTAVLAEAGEPAVLAESAS